MNAPVKIEAEISTAPHVLTAINAVMADISREGIGKDMRNEQQKYNFRGIDQVYNALAPLFARHKLIVKPRGLSRDVTERTGRSYEGKPGAALFYVTVAMEFDLISAVDGSRETAGPFYGEAMDSGDKATNKAQSAAFKYFAMQQFVIPTEGDNDADATTHEVKPGWVTAAESAIIMLRTSADCDGWYKSNIAMLRGQDKALVDGVLALLKRQKDGLVADEKKAEARFRRDDSSRVAGGDASADPFADDEIPF